MAGEGRGNLGKACVQYRSSRALHHFPCVPVLAPNGFCACPIRWGVMAICQPGNAVVNDMLGNATHAGDVQRVEPAIEVVEDFSV